MSNIQKTNTIFADPSPSTKERMLNGNIFKKTEMKKSDFSIKKKGILAFENVQKSDESINIRTSNEFKP